MKYLDCSTLCLPLLCKELGYYPTIYAQCIVCLEDGAPIAGVVYDGFNGKSIQAHIWVKTGCNPGRAWFWAIFDYPYNRLGVNKILGQVASNNKDAIALDSHFGFTLEGTVKNYSDDGDLLLYTMTKSECRVLNSSRWRTAAQALEKRAA